jgi:hypothetical protein
VSFKPPGNNELHSNAKFVAHNVRIQMITRRRGESDGGIVLPPPFYLPPIKGEAKNALSLWERDRERDEELSTSQRS